MGNDEPLKWHLMLPTTLLGDECYLNKNRESGQFHIEDKEENESYQTSFTDDEITYLNGMYSIEGIFILVPQEEKQ